MVIPMKKGILTLIFTLICCMAARGFGRNLQNTELSLSSQNTTAIEQTAITAPLDTGR